MRPFLPALAILLAFLPPTLADHCESYSTSEPEITLHGVGPAPALYVDNDLCQLCMWSIWVYEESNGLPGLQRGDEVVDDTCHGSIRSDTIIF